MTDRGKPDKRRGEVDGSSIEVVPSRVSSPSRAVDEAPLREDYRGVRSPTRSANFSQSDAAGSGDHRDLFGEKVDHRNRRPGRKRHDPDPKMRAKAKNLRLQGLSQAEVAKEMGLHVNTLLRHYAFEVGSKSLAALRYVDPEDAAGMSSQRVGRPRHVPTDSARILVRTMSAKGVSLSQIAAVVGVALQTLKRHYCDDLVGRHDI